MANVIRPEQAEGYGENDLAACVMEGLRALRDDPVIHRLRAQERIAHLDDLLRPMAEACGVACDDFKRYLGDLLGASHLR